MPAHAHEVHRRRGDIGALLEQGYSLEEAAIALGMSPRTVVGAWQMLVQQPTRLDAPLPRGDGSNISKMTVADIIADPRHIDEEERREIDEEMARVRAVMTDFPSRTLRIIEERAAGKTLEEVGDGLNLTRERIRQIEAKAIKKIRKRLGVKMEVIDQQEEEATEAPLVEHEEWVNLERAVSISGKSAATIYGWKKSGTLRARHNETGRMVFSTADIGKIMASPPKRGGRPKGSDSAESKAPPQIEVVTPKPPRAQLEKPPRDTVTFAFNAGIAAAVEHARRIELLLLAHLVTLITIAAFVARHGK